MFKPCSKNSFPERSKAVLLLWIIFVIYASCLSCFLVCSLQPRGHLLGNGQPLGLLVCEVFFCVLSIFHVVPLVRRILIYDLCLLTFFHLATQCVQSIPDDNTCEGFRQYID